MKSLAPPLIKGLIFTVVTVLATTVLAITIANSSVGDTVTYSAVFDDVTSLNDGDDVRMSGVRVGQVEDMQLQDRRLAKVTFSVQAKRKLPASVHAVIKYRNLVGQRYIALEQGTGEVNGVLAPGATIPRERTQSALDLTALFNGFKPLFQALSPQDVNALSGEIVQVLQGEGGTIDSLLAHTASLTNTLAGKDKVIGEVVDNLNAVLDTVNARGDQLSSLVTTTQQLVSGLAKDSVPIGNAIDAMATLTTTTAGLLGEDRAPLKQSISALNTLAGTLDENSPLVDSFLETLPGKLDAIGRTASYGSWFNFFLCSATTDAQPAPGGSLPGIPITQSRCVA
ncbi:MCE family protein [Labedaea rhizosphaerae]|uniref:Phospholipid/cholesterol/gamma-HCH transport system substrate-binding protein n=1 Tax=Labedaea rhizosphaerae TaxID=598644 RepID=A0A4R6S7E5_LABRH|nr:MCE family protein [Labedaea rhizosphaerae]TDP95167.1 phospholipid/cholesterol/gamma-HCH transport system substrate-binding protein [Labedaea rhizosphaerae]